MYSHLLYDRAHYNMFRHHHRSQQKPCSSCSVQDRVQQVMVSPARLLSPASLNSGQQDNMKASEWF